MKKYLNFLLLGLLIPCSIGFAKEIFVKTRVMTAQEFNQFKNFTGEYQAGKNYNLHYQGYGTGLKPPTVQEWERLKQLPIFIESIQFSQIQAPTAYDNSTTIWFPPIGNQDGEGSCVSWACGYYTKTFQEAQEHNWDLSGCNWEGGYYGHPSVAYQNKIFSPDFIYHQVNDGGDNGSYYSDNMDLLERIGCCTWDKMPYNPSDTTTWPGEEAWRQAPWYRSKTGFTTMNVETNTALDNLKLMLANNNLAVISINADYYNRLTNKDLWTLDNYSPTTTNHANTIVGYDDNFGPYTESGSTNTYGAFKVANSWGVGNWEKVADGFYYISYKTIKQRIKYIYFYENKVNYQPTVIAVFNLSHTLRGECKTTLGIGSTSAPYETKKFDEFNFNGGNWPFPSNNMVLDITEFNSYMIGTQDNFFLSVYDGETSKTGRIMSFSIEIYQDYATGIPAEVHISPHPPVNTINGSTVYAQVNRSTPQVPTWITIKSPNGGEVWKSGTPQEVRWESDRFTGQVRIELSTSGGNTWTDITLGANTNNDGSYIFTPASSNISSDCLFRVTSIENPTVTDVSDKKFTIVDPSAIKHYVAVQIPDAISEPIIDGDLNDAAWTYANNSEVLQTGGVPDIFLTPWTNFSDNKVTWKALWSPNTNLLYVAIEVQDDVAGIVDNDTELLWQDDCIELFTDGNHNGGNYSGSYSEAQNWLIRRDNTKHLDHMSGIYTGPAMNSAVKYLAQGNWILELSLKVYNQYPSTVRTLMVNDIIGWEVWYDDSDNTSMVNGSWARDHQVGWGYLGPAYYNADAFQELELGLPPQTQLTVITPNGGEFWDIGSNQGIKWNSQNNSGLVNIELSRDGGSSWETIADSTIDDQSFFWTVSGPVSNSCYIRITDVDGMPSDNSDAAFTIAPQQLITITTPNGGEIWQVGSNKTISWTSMNTSGVVKIELSRNNGLGWETLIPNTPDDNSYNWIVLGPASKSCKIKITDIDGSPCDSSDGLFAIAPEWMMPISISAGNNTFIRTFGGDVNASDGYNPDADEATAPPGMTYYCYFELGMFPNYLDTDIRRWITPFDNEICWILKIVNANNVVSTLSWNPAKLPAYGIFLLSGTELEIDMRNKNSTSVPGSATLMIKYAPLEITYHFPNPGWYLISLPVTPATNSLNTLFPSAVDAFAYNSSTRAYDHVTVLEPRKGYWLLIPTATASTISGIKLSSYTEYYATGWHLIGSVWDTTSFTDPDDNPDGSVIAAYGYNPATGQYSAVYPSTTGKLIEKQGYWLAVTKPCNLTIGKSSIDQKVTLPKNNLVEFESRYGLKPPEPPIFIDHQGRESLSSADKIISHSYPNPFNSETLIEYDLPEAGLTQVHVYNTLGQLIRTLVETYQQAGTHRVIWDGRNDYQITASNGLYFYQISNSNRKTIKKILFIK